MLENWLSPIEPTSIVNKDILHEFAIFHSIEIHEAGDMPSLKDVPLVFIGLDDSANEVRKHLYSLSWHFGELQCVDLGNVRKNHDDFVTQILTELIDGEIIPIILGGKDIKPIPQFLAHKGIRKFSNIAIVSEKIPYSPDSEEEEGYIYQLLSKYSSHILNLGFLGFQSHYCHPTVMEWMDNERYDHLRLGIIKADMEEAEPMIRDADMVLFQLDALKQTECPGVERGSPNGLLAEEACQMCWYAGMSDKLGSFSISGFIPQNDIREQSAQLVAQMVWYFIDGFQARKKDYPASNTGMTEYVVDYKNYDYQITFWKSNQSGRWWMQIPLNSKEELNRHRLVPCSYNDYKLSCAGEFPDRLLLALERFGE